MQQIGLLGGLSYLSSVEYCRLINEDVRARLGDHRSGAGGSQGGHEGGVRWLLEWVLSGVGG